MKPTIRNIVVASLMPLLLGASAMAADPTPPIASVYAAYRSLFLPFLAVTLAVNLALLVWVESDAKGRGTKSTTLWMVLVMFSGPIGLIVYLLSRPQGDVVACDSCGGKKLTRVAICPRCGSTVRGNHNRTFGLPLSGT